MVRTRSALAAASGSAQSSSNTTLSSDSPTPPSPGNNFTSATQTLPGITITARAVFDRGDPVSFQKKLPAEVQIMVLKELLVSSVPIVLATRNTVSSSERHIDCVAEGPDLPGGTLEHWEALQGKKYVAFTENKGFHRYENGLLEIAATCKEIKNKVLPIYYGDNIFYFRSTSTLHSFLKVIGRTRRQLLKTVTFDYQGNKRGRGNAFRMLATCGQLNKLTVALQSETTYEPGFLEGARGFKALLKVKCTTVILTKEACPKSYTDKHVEEVQEVMTKAMCSARKEVYGVRRSTRAVKQIDYEEILEHDDEE